MKNSEIKQNNYLKIKTAASTLFFILGVERTDMYQIAASSGLSKASLYKYFNTKYELAKELIEDAMAERDAELEDARGAILEGTGAEGMRKLLDHVIDISEKDLPFYALYIDYGSHVQRFEAGKAPEFFRQAEEKLKTIFLAVLEKGLSDGTFKTELDPERLYEAVIGSLQGSKESFFLKYGGDISSAKLRDLRAQLAFTAQAAMNMMTK